MSTDDQSQPMPDATPRLSPPDAEALDAMVEAGMAPPEAGGPTGARVDRVRRLLSLLEAGGPLAGRQIRTERVMAAVGVREAQPELCGDDAEALDAWVLVGFDATRVPGSLRSRARAHEALAALVTSAGPAWGDPEREDLVERTIARVRAVGQSAEQSYRFRPVASRARWSDLLSAAAVLLIAGSVLWPVLSTVREGARRAVCESNLSLVSHALGGYTADHDAMLPMVNAGFGGSTWWQVGQDPSKSNSANLYTLARQHYLGLEALACPGNPRAATAPRSPDAMDWSSFDELSYSYRVMARAERDLWGSPTELVVVADRSPVIIRAVHGQTIFPFESSPNHDGRGQHGVFADGSARWLESPVLPSGDNIWLPKPIEIMIDAVSRRAGLDPLQGTEAPADRQDSFVGP